MKGKLIKIGDDWMVEYDYHHVHAGISKMGTGPGVGKKITEKKQLPLHPDDELSADLYYPDSLNMEVEFTIDYKTPMGMKYGQEQYSNILQQTYGTSAKIINKEEPQENWDEIFQTFENFYRDGVMAMDMEDLRRFLSDNYLPSKRMKP